MEPCACFSWICADYKTIKQRNTITLKRSSDTLDRFFMTEKFSFTYCIFLGFKCNFLSFYGFCLFFFLQRQNIPKDYKIPVQYIPREVVRHRSLLPTVILHSLANLLLTLPRFFQCKLNLLTVTTTDSY